MGQKEIYIDRGADLLNKNKSWITKSATQLGLLIMNDYKPSCRSAVITPASKSGGPTFDLWPESQLLAVNACKRSDSVRDQSMADSFPFS
jgi:hypothetical protein